MSRVSRRSLVTRLEAMRVDAPLSDVFADDLAARLQSLAVAASFEVGATKGRYRRKFVAAIGSIGVIGWIGVTGAAASVGLATTGNLPAPVQDVVSTVFDVVGIDIPTSDESEPAPVEEPNVVDDQEVPVDDSVPPTDGVTIPETPTTDVPVTDVPLTDVIVPDESLVGPPVSSARPGNSGSTPAVTAPGRVTNPGNSGNTPAATAPGQAKKGDDAVDEKPAVTAPGQVKKGDDAVDEKPAVTAPGQAKKDEAVSDVVVDEKPSVTAPGQSNNDNKATAPGQVKKSDDESGSAKKKSE